MSASLVYTQEDGYCYWYCYFEFYNLHNIKRIYSIVSQYYNIRQEEEAAKAAAAAAAAAAKPPAAAEEEILELTDEGIFDTSKLNSKPSAVDVAVPLPAAPQIIDTQADSSILGEGEKAEPVEEKTEWEKSEEEEDKIPPRKNPYVCMYAPKKTQNEFFDHC